MQLDPLGARTFARVLGIENLLDRLVDIKSVRRPHEYWRAQLLSYLRSTGLIRGLVINFGMSTLKEGIQRFSL